jgi:hypothetical protein
VSAPDPAGYRRLDPAAAFGRRDCLAVFDGPQAAEMDRLLGVDVYPVRSPAPIRIRIGSSRIGVAGTFPALLLDEARLTPAQRARIVVGLAVLLGVDEAEVERDMAGRGIPLLIQPNVTVAIYVPLDGPTPSSN